MKDWLWVYDSFDPHQEGQREALCTLGNGYFATRGAYMHYPGTYLAGGYNRLKTSIAGQTIENEDLVNLPNWLLLQFRFCNGEWFDLQKVTILSFRQELNLKLGVLSRSVLFEEDNGRKTKLEEKRIVHMENPHLAALQTTITSCNWSGEVVIRSGLDGTVKNCGVSRYKELNNQHLMPCETGFPLFLKMQFSQAKLFVAMAANTTFSQEILKKDPIEKPDFVAEEYTLKLSQGKPLAIEKIVALYTSRDKAISECGMQAKKEIRLAGNFDTLLERHILAWKHLWERFDIEIEHEITDEPIQRILRLHIFHLLQTASLHTMDLDVSVPARGLHGEAYRGHIYWDELFIFPSINFRLPEITRSFFYYRCRRLPKACNLASEAGYKGAMFPWQSGSSGREESQKLHLNPKSGRWVPDNSALQRHVNCAIAYNIWQYYLVTKDIEFLSFYGAEMILEIARFWSSFASYNEALDRYEILHVMGPDEYHDAYPHSSSPGINNNAYTNVTVVWTLLKALEILKLLPQRRQEELVEKLHLHEEELQRWDAITRKMRIVFHQDGIISQFEGYEALKEFDWEGYWQKYGDIQRLDRILESENDSVNHYKISKQADVLMLFYLFSAPELKALFTRLGYPFEHETIPSNINYYSKRTSHGSTLSRIVHSWVLARTDRKRSWKLFCDALVSDVKDIQGGTTQEGIHLGAMGGAIDMIQRGYLGLEVQDDTLIFHPSFPEEIKSLRMTLYVAGCELAIELQKKTRALTIRHKDTLFVVDQDATCRVTISEII